MSRPTKYKVEYDNIAKKMCELGATDKDIIEALGVAESTFYLWRLKHPSFSESLKVGKTATDDRVEMSLYRKAVGYRQENVKIMQHQGEPVIIPYTEIVEPDTTAAIFWLKNRRPEAWRANPEGAENPDNKLTINIVDARKPDEE